MKKGTPVEMPSNFVINKMELFTSPAKIVFFYKCAKYIHLAPLPLRHFVDWGI